MRAHAGVYVCVRAGAPGVLTLFIPGQPSYRRFREKSVIGGGSAGAGSKTSQAVGDVIAVVVQIIQFTVL